MYLELRRAFALRSTSSQDGLPNTVRPRDFDVIVVLDCWEASCRHRLVPRSLDTELIRLFGKSTSCRYRKSRLALESFNLLKSSFTPTGNISTVEIRPGPCFEGWTVLSALSQRTGGASLLVLADVALTPSQQKCSSISSRRFHGARSLRWIASAPDYHRGLRQAQLTTLINPQNFAKGGPAVTIGLTTDSDFCRAPLLLIFVLPEH